jgi:hypothetical protein
VPTHSGQLPAPLTCCRSRAGVLGDDSFPLSMGDEDGLRVGPSPRAPRLSPLSEEGRPGPLDWAPPAPAPPPPPMPLPMPEWVPPAHQPTAPLPLSHVPMLPLSPPFVRPSLQHYPKPNPAGADEPRYPSISTNVRRASHFPACPPPFPAFFSSPSYFPCL